MKRAAARPAIEIRVVRLAHARGLALPAYQSAGAAGMDLLAAVPARRPIELAPGGRALVPTGLILDKTDPGRDQLHRTEPLRDGRPHGVEDLGRVAAGVIAHGLQQLLGPHQRGPIWVASLAARHPAVSFAQSATALSSASSVT